MRRNAAHLVAEGRGAGGVPVTEATPGRHYPQPDPAAFAEALTQVERDLAGRRLSADGAPEHEDAARRSTAWARALRARGWPARQAPLAPEPWADPDFLDEDGEPIDYSDAPEVVAEAWTQARPSTFYADLWEANLAQRVAELVRERRDALGLTQEQVAERTGLPQSSVSRVETGRHLPTMATLARLAVALGLAWRVDITLRGARISAMPSESTAVPGDTGDADPVQRRPAQLRR